MNQNRPVRRGFLSKFLGAGAIAAAASAAQAQAPASANSGNAGGLSGLSRARTGRRKRISSFDRTGGNNDRIKVNAGQTATISEIDGAGSIRHIWMTIADNEPDYFR